MDSIQLRILLSEINKDTQLLTSSFALASPSFSQLPRLTLWPFSIDTMAAELVQLTRYLSDDFDRFAWINHPASFEMPEDSYTEGWISNALAVTVGYQKEQEFITLTDNEGIKGISLYFSHAARLTALQPLVLELFELAIRAYGIESSSLFLMPVSDDSQVLTGSAPMCELATVVSHGLMETSSPYNIAILNAGFNLPGAQFGNTESVLQPWHTPRQLGQLIGIELSCFDSYELSLSESTWAKLIKKLSTAESRNDFYIGIAETFAYSNSCEYSSDPDLDEANFILDNTLSNFAGDVQQLEGIIAPVDDFIRAVKARYQLLATGKLDRDTALELPELPVSTSVTRSTQQNVSLVLQQEFNHYDHACFTVASLQNDPCLLLTKSNICTLQPLPEGKAISFNNPDDFQGIWGHNGSKMFARHNVITYDGQQTEACQYWGLKDDNEIFNVAELMQSAEHVNVTACGQYVAMQIEEVIKIWHIAEQAWLEDFPLPAAVDTDEDDYDDDDDEDEDDAGLNIDKICYIPQQQICLVQITYGNLLRLDHSGVTHQFNYNDPSYFSYTPTLFDVHPKTTQILVASVILSMDDLSIIEQLPRFSVGIDESELAWIWHPTQACVVAFSSRGIKTFDCVSRRWQLLSAQALRFENRDPAKQPKFNHNGEYLLTYNWEEQRRYQLWNWQTAS